MKGTGDCVWPTSKERADRGGETTCKRSDSQHSEQTKCQRKRQGKLWRWRWRWRNFCGRANFWASMKLLPNRLQAIFTRVACLWSCVSGRHQLVSLSFLLLLLCGILACVFHLFFLPCPFFSPFWPVNETEICFVGPLHTANGDLSRLPRGSFVSCLRWGSGGGSSMWLPSRKWQLATSAS